MTLTGISGASLSNIAQICLTASDSIVVNYTGSATYCPDTLVLNCSDTTMTLGGCVKIIGDEINCLNGSPQFTFWMKNELNYPIQSIVIDPSNTGMLLVPGEITIAPPGILPNQTGGPFTLNMTGTTTPGLTFCYTVEVHEKPLAQNPLFIHRDTIDKGCRTIPECEDLQGICLASSLR